MTATPHATPYPAWLEIDYPDRPLDRLTTFFRPIVFVPVGILLGLLSGPGRLRQPHEAAESGRMLVLIYGSGGILVLPTALMLLFRRKYPHWWFDWNLELTRFSTRCLAFLTLLRDEYPSTDEAQAVHLDVEYPDASALSPWLPLVKWLLALPAGALRLRRRGLSLGTSSQRLCLPAHHRSVSAVHSAGRLGEDSSTFRSPARSRP
jgi:hypothetical protein